MVNIWQISPGRERDNLWQEFRDAGIIAIGWEMGDLRQFKNEADLQNKARLGLNDTNSCWTFSHLIKKGDIIVAKKGQSKQIYGMGKATDEYKYDDGRPYYKHTIPVDWRIKFDKLVTVNAPKLFIQTTVGKLDSGRLDAIDRSIGRRKRSATLKTL